MKKPDITETIEREGFKIHRSLTRCPFHDDTRPSLRVFSRTNTWYCFPCGIGGDAISFVMRRHSMNFVEATEYLRLEKPRTCKRDIDRQKELKKYRTWESAYYSEMCTLYRTIQNHKRSIIDMDPCSQEAYHQEAITEYHMDIIQYGDNQTKMALYREKRYGGGVGI